MRETFLSFSPPLIGEDEIAEVVDTLRSDWISTGPKTKLFEQQFAAFVGAPSALALNSCTGALHVGLLASGVGPGSIAITTPMTFCSTVHVIEHVGATPVLVDVQPDTLNIDPVQLLRAVERANRVDGAVDAILPVHLYGHPCDMDPILEIAREHRMVIVEDAAHALPSEYRGSVIGSGYAERGGRAVPLLSAFSFYATKNLTTGEGGMLAGDADLLDKARIWSLHGMSRDAYKRYGAQGSWYYEVLYPGFKYNMSDIQAAIGLQQLRKLPDFSNRRRRLARLYDDAFADTPELQLPIERPDVVHAWHLYVLRLQLETLAIDRARFIDELKALNIGASVHFIPVHLHPYYRDRYGYRPEHFPVASQEYQRIVSLPLCPRMADRDAEDVVGAVQQLLRRFRR